MLAALHSVALTARGRANYHWTRILHTAQEDLMGCRRSPTTPGCCCSDGPLQARERRERASGAARLLLWPRAPSTHALPLPEQASHRNALGVPPSTLSPISNEAKQASPQFAPERRKSRYSLRGVASPRVPPLTTSRPQAPAPLLRPRRLPNGLVDHEAILSSHLTQK